MLNYIAKEQFEARDRAKMHREAIELERIAAFEVIEAEKEQRRTRLAGCALSLRNFFFVAYRCSVKEQRRQAAARVWGRLEKTTQAVTARQSSGYMGGTYKGVAQLIPIADRDRMHHSCFSMHSCGLRIRSDTASVTQNDQRRSRRGWPAAI